MAELFADGDVEAEALLEGEVEVNEEGDLVLYRDNDNVYRLRNFRDTRTDPATPLNAATVTGTLYDEDDVGGTPLVAAQTLAKIAGSDGLYEAAVDKALIPSSGGGAVPEGRHVLRIVGAEAGLDFQKDVYVEVRDRLEDLRP